MSKSRIRPFLVSLFFLAGPGGGVEITPPNDSSVVLARVGDTVITQAEVDASAAEVLEELRSKRLLAEVVYQREVERARAVALKALVDRRLEEARALDKAPEEAPDVEVFFVPARYAIAADGAPSRGSQGAMVTLVEFADFECPFSAGLFPTLQETLDKYSGKVRLVFVNFPLGLPNTAAFRAAEVALCAEQQGQFWALHDLFFQQPRPPPKRRSRRAQQRGPAGSQETRAVSR